MWYRRILLVHQAIGRVSEVGGNLDDYNDVSRDNRTKRSAKRVVTTWSSSSWNFSITIVEEKVYNVNEHRKEDTNAVSLTRLINDHNGSEIVTLMLYSSNDSHFLLLAFISLCKNTTSRMSSQSFIPHVARTAFCILNSKCLKWLHAQF